MPPTENVSGEKKSCIDVRLVPIKAHYIFYYGAMGCVMSILPIIMKSVGLNATSVGTILSILPFCVIIGNFLICALADYLQKPLCIMTCLIVATVVSFSSMLLVPTIPPDPNLAIVDCEDNFTNIVISNTYDASCVSQNSTLNVICELLETICTQSWTGFGSNEALAVSGCRNRTLKFNLYFSKDMSALTKEQAVIFNQRLPTEENNMSMYSLCASGKNHPSSITCSPSIDGCLSHAKDSNVSAAYTTFQFWVIMFLVCAGGTSVGTISRISDATCYEILEDRFEDFGKQVLWSSLAWGAITFLAGFLNDLKTLDPSRPNFSSSIYFMLSMSLIDIGVIWCFIKLKIVSSSPNILKDVASVFTSFKVIELCLGAFSCGVLAGFLWSYEFWFLEDLGASQMLLGTAVAIQSISEGGFFYFSGWIIKKLGHPVCLISTFAVYAFRFYMYSLIINPWFVLLIDMLQGWTFAMVYSTLTSYASICALPGTEVTMQGIFGGIYEGLGFAVGGLLGGVGFDQMGDRETFHSASVLSLILTVVFSISAYYSKKKLATPKAANTTQEIEKPTETLARNSA